MVVRPGAALTMAADFTLWVPGAPRGKGRPHVQTVRWGKKDPLTGARAKIPLDRPLWLPDDKTAAEEERIKLLAIRAMNLAGVSRFHGPVALFVLAVFQFPKSITRKEAIRRLWHTQKPDGDNVVKTVGDAFNGVVWGDDSAVVAGPPLKTWSPDREGYDIRVLFLSSDPERFRAELGRLRTEFAAMTERMAQFRGLADDFLGLAGGGMP